MYPVNKRSVMLSQILLLAGATGSQSVFATNKSQRAGGKRPIRSGILHQNFNLKISPRVDFFRHVNGTWLEKTGIPSDKSSYGVITMLHDQTTRQLRILLDKISHEENLPPGSDRQKVRDLFRSFMNTANLENLKAAPLAADLKKIEAISNRKKLAEYFGAGIRDEVEGPLSFYVYTDYLNPDINVIYLSQSSLGMGDRDRYLNKDSDAINLRKKYQKHIDTMFHLAGLTGDPEEEPGKIILDMETDLARIQMSREDLRNADKTYHPYTEKNITQLIPGFDCASFLASAGLSNRKVYIVRTKEYFRQLSGILKKYKTESWKIWLKWRLLSDRAPLLSKDLDYEHFLFYEGVMKGVKFPEERWKRGIKIINQLLGELMGKEYIREHFQPEAREKMLEMVDNLRSAWKSSIENLEWMGKDTRQKALQKLSLFTAKVGYPDHWKDYSQVIIKSDDLTGNYLRVSHFNYDREIAKIGKKPDKNEWMMNPQTVNAYYNPGRNEIVFPAAILQPPFFDRSADDAINYGAIGSVIGHEMGHGFDDQGSKFDGHGKKSDWWSKEDREKFQKRTARLIAQYNSYQPLPDKPINGQFTLGENIGDLGGVSISYKAFRRSLKNGVSPVMDGMTGDQRFFVGWAQVWAVKYTPENQAMRLLSDPHSPGEFRVNGVVSNVPAFYNAFGVKKGDPMYLKPSERVRIW